MATRGKKTTRVPGRKRLLAGRSFLTLGMFIAAAWFTSRWYILWLWSDHGGDTTGYGIGRGVVGVREFLGYPTGNWNRLSFDRIPDPGWLFWQWHAQPTGFNTLAVSFWPLAVVTLAFGAALLASARFELAKPRPSGLNVVLPSAPRPKLPARKRLVLGAVLLSLGILAVAACAVSTLWMVEAERRSWTLSFSSGLFRLTHGPDAGHVLCWRRADRPSNDPAFFWAPKSLVPVPAPAWSTPIANSSLPISSMLPLSSPAPATPPVTEWRLWIAGGATYGANKLRMLAVWPFPPLFIVGGAVLLWSGVRVRRRAITGSCLTCGYSLTGLGIGAPCPECGKAVPSA